MGEDADLFVGFLPGDTDFGERHDDVFTATGGVSAGVLKIEWGTHVAMKGSSSTIRLLMTAG